MKRLYLTLTVYVLIALALSVFAANYLTRNPVFVPDFSEYETALNPIADELVLLLVAEPVENWDALLRASVFDSQYYIDWYATNDYDLSLPEQKVLVEEERQLVDQDNGTYTLEVLFKEQLQILVISPQASGTELLNTMLLVACIMAICLAVAALALSPYINRLKQIQTLASYYRAGQWQQKNTDKTPDPVGELGESLEKMASQIQVLMDNNDALVKDQRDLMQALTHQFRAPLARMRFALDMHEDAAEPTALNKEISTALDELNDMVGEILRYARLQAGAPDLHLDPISLPRLVEETCSYSRKAWPEADIRFNYSGEALNVNGDADHLHRALSNLIGNAAKYGKPGNSIVKVQIEADDGHALIHVDDNGNGICQSDRAHVFKPFVRLDSSRSKSISGNGLGLAIVQGVANKHGGDTSISRSPMGGARFTLSLPR